MWKIKEKSGRSVLTDSVPSAMVITLFDFQTPEKQTSIIVALKNKSNKPGETKFGASRRDISPESIAPNRRLFFDLQDTHFTLKTLVAMSLTSNCLISANPQRFAPFSVALQTLF